MTVRARSRRPDAETRARRRGRISVDKGSGTPDENFTVPSEPEEDKPTGPGLSMADALASADVNARVPTAADPLVSPCSSSEVHAIEVEVHDQDGKPRPGLEVQLSRNDDEALLGETDAAGWVRFDGLEPGRYSVGLPGIDNAAWSAAAPENLPDDRGKSHGKAQWASPSQPPGQTTHTVQPGEGVYQLARLHGMLVETLWAANAALHPTRDDPNILSPGDELTIPARELGAEAVSSGQRLTLKVQEPQQTLELQFIDIEGKPRGGVPYLLTIRTKSGDLVISGKTDGQGAIKQPVPPEASRATLALGQGEHATTYELSLNYLEPVDGIRGARARLLNLGYVVGEADDETLDPITARALLDFQRDMKLEPKGRLDDPTLAKLRELHCS
ncbi:MAG: peptidoglycan-binding protein [Myxococcota bacterium]